MKFSKLQFRNNMKAVIIIIIKVQHKNLQRELKKESHLHFKFLQLKGVLLNHNHMYKAGEAHLMVMIPKEILKLQMKQLKVKERKIKLQKKLTKFLKVMPLF